MSLVCATNEVTIKNVATYIIIKCDIFFIIFYVFLFLKHSLSHLITTAACHTRSLISQIYIYISHICLYVGMYVCEYAHASILPPLFTNFLTTSSS